MCQAMPRRVLRVEADRAEVLVNGRPVWVSTRTLPGLAAGDYVLVYAGHALERLSATEAQAVLDLLAEIATLVEPPDQEREGPYGS